MNTQQMTDDWNVVIATEDDAYTLGMEHYCTGQFNPPKGYEEYLAYMRGQHVAAKKQNAVNAVDYYIGINLYRNGDSIAACTNKAQRYGWRDAQVDARVAATAKFSLMLQAMVGDEMPMEVGSIEDDAEFIRWGGA